MKATKQTEKIVKRMWSLTDALAFIKSVSPDLENAGWGIALTGSVLYAGSSLNDLDVVLYPLDASSSSWVDKEQARAVLERHELSLWLDVDQVQEYWRKKGSQDTKHVEVWKQKSRRVDVFFLR